ncbi:hypothetical protein Hypma_016201 [Hypsizygus marmoreus]|uniref:Uncharacterized protein n=1 Tax=Hypsizygus marmoreus TaxID=39966 RepID=A0A369IZ15_HYPMA|nr:hypothetical protein Hypma_016201 [Hypsizygus marmoreus]
MALRQSLMLRLMWMPLPLALGPNAVAKNEVLLDDITGYQAKSLPKNCEVFDPDLQDPLLASSYVGLPNLYKGTLDSWDTRSGPGQINFIAWGPVPGYDLQLYADKKVAVCLSQCLQTDSYLRTPPPQGLQQMRLSGIFHSL